MIELKSGKTKDVKMALELAREVGVQNKVAFGVTKTSLKEIQKSLGPFQSYMDARNVLLLFFSFFLGRCWISYSK